MLLAYQRLQDGNQILARMYDVSFEINFKEKKIFKYVHVQVALPKEIFKCFFFLFEWWNTASWSCRTFIQQLQTIKNLLVKAPWSFCTKSSEKKNRLKHRITLTEMCCESEDRSE